MSRQGTDTKSKFASVIQGLLDHRYGWVFASPVDPVLLGIPDYFDIITEPMDLGTIQQQLGQNRYETHYELQRDVTLCFDNAIRYNDQYSPVHGVASELKRQFEEAFANVLAEEAANGAVPAAEGGEATGTAASGLAAAAETVPHVISSALTLAVSAAAAAAGGGGVGGSGNGSSSSSSDDDKLDDGGSTGGR